MVIRIEANTYLRPGMFKFVMAWNCDDITRLPTSAAITALLRATNNRFAISGMATRD